MYRYNREQRRAMTRRTMLSVPVARRGSVSIFLANRSGASLGGDRSGIRTVAVGASAMRRRPRAGGGGAEPVPLEGGLSERPGLAEAVVGRLVEPGVERGRPSACPTAEALGRTACRTRRPRPAGTVDRGDGAERRVGGQEAGEEVLNEAIGAFSGDGTDDAFCTGSDGADHVRGRLRPVPDAQATGSSTPRRGRTRSLLTATAGPIGW